MKYLIILSSIFVSIFSLDGYGQKGIDYDIKKPEKYENRKLGYEKTAETKFKVPRHFIQNTVTHYNYYFNANNKLTEIVERAKAQNRDDFSKLLPFYNYSLDVTASSRRDLDSIIDKCITAILIHDLRNDWVDNLYMLMGKAYYFRKDMDSAYSIFQFINYAFAPREEDGYFKPIASNANTDDGGNNFIVSTSEKRNIVKKTFSLPPSRNESLIWQIQTYLARDQIIKAGVLIDVLKHDPQFPARLQPDLHEVQSLWFYKQQLYDSAAVHLEKALGKAANKLEQARWEFLIAQLYERAGKPGLSKEFYERTIQHTYDPVMDVFARLNAIRQNQGTGEGTDYIQKNIDALKKLGRKEIYADYRDIIYYTAAQMELQQNQKQPAIDFLLKSVHYSLPISTQKDKSYLELGDLAFADKEYKIAKNFYDSVNVADTIAIENLANFTDRKKALGRIVLQLDIIDRQDSLLRIAAMTPNDRTAYIKKMLKALRKQQGLAEEEQQDGQRPSFNNSGTGVQDMFGNSSGAEWYFYNGSLKSKGFNDFRSKWGNRPNVDNWQVASMVTKQGLLAKKTPGQGLAADNEQKQPVVAVTSFETLLANVPLTPEQNQKCMDSLERAYFALGKSYQDGLPDYFVAIASYDSLLEKFPSTRYREETFFNLYFCYKKIGDEQNAKRMLDLLRQLYPSGKFTRLATDPNGVDYAQNAPRIEATKRYEQIYTAFIEGSFEQALADKKAADSLYGDNYWTPQLLYIESVYFIHERQDSAAIATLTTITKKYAGTPMAAKAKNILNVLGRRKQIEDYLTNLKIERATDDSLSQGNNARANPRLSNSDSLEAADSLGAKVKAVSLAKADQKDKPGADRMGIQKISPTAAQLATVKVDQAKLAALRKQADSIQAALLDAKNNADKMASLKRQNDSIQTVLKQMKSDSTLAAASRIASVKTAFVYSPGQSHSVVLLLNKVDPVYVTEARNAFNRYDKEYYYNRTIDITTTGLDDSTKLMLIRGFENADAALDYVDKARKMAPMEILPWLPAAKYSFMIITDQNLDMLQSNKDLGNYKKFLGVYYPGKF
ncbi:MAG TPA: hypothetical protein VK543_13875 [Puia sp.]|nr:hypothetical protein [Puia sp.]